MKKFITLCVAMLAAVSISAQQREIGVVAGGLNGLSYKRWFSSNVAIQTDLAVGLTLAPYGAYFNGTKVLSGTNSQYDVTLNPSLVYHMDMPASFKLYLGGGVNIGMVNDIKNANPNAIFGKAGANALAGFSYGFGNSPWVLAFDFRPGYGFAFRDEKKPHVHFFDWKLAMALRYTL